MVNNWWTANKLHMMAFYLIYVWNGKGRGISLPIIRWMLHLWKCLAVNLACLQVSVENHLVTELVLGTQPSPPCRLRWGMAGSSLALLQRSTQIIKKTASFFWHIKTITYIQVTCHCEDEETNDFGLSTPRGGSEHQNPYKFNTKII